MAVDATLIVVIALLVLYIVLVFYYHDPRGENLNPLEKKQLKLMLDYKTATVESGNWLDNFVVYARNGHAILSIFFPTNYNPINGAERVGILFMTAVAAVALQSLRSGMADGFILDICIVSLPVLIVDYFLFYMATRQDVAIMERDEDEDKGEWCEEEINMRQGNLVFLVTTRNERAIVNQVSSKSQCGQYGFYCLMVSCAVVVVIMGLSGVSSGWLTNWLLAFAYWFATAPIIFSVKYCREDPFTFNDGDDGDDHESFADVPEMTPDDVKAFMEEWAGDQCCYGAGAAADIDVVSVVGKCTKKLIFDSWSEARWKQSKEEKYHGDHPIGWSDDREEPGIWDMNPERAQSWHENQRTQRVPGTEHVIRCDRCNGSGHITEKDSEGNSHEKTCPKCGGSGKRLKYKDLVDQFGCRSQTYTLDVSSCPVFMIEGVGSHDQEDAESGNNWSERDRDDGNLETLCDDCDDDLFKQELMTFAAHHKEIDNSDSARILKQRFGIEMIPIYEVSYNSDEIVKMFYLIGEDKVVYWPSKEYGVRCCHCCNCFDCNNCGKPTCACLRC